VAAAAWDACVVHRQRPRSSRPAAADCE
jgi:hypothetical protein